MANKIKIIIAEDHALYRDGLRTMLNSHKDFEIIDEAVNGSELIKLFEFQKPDIVLMDINMPVLNGIEATKFITTHFNDTKVIAITMNDEKSSIMDMMDAGSNGYVLKSDDKDDIIKAINTVFNGDDYYSKNVENSIINLIHSKKSNENIKKKIYFNEKELQLINYLCDELNSEEISKKMFLSKKTIDGLRLKIKNDLGVKNSIGIIKYAIKEGFVKI